MQKKFSRIICVLLAVIMTLGNFAYAVPYLDTAESSGETTYLAEEVSEGTATLSNENAVRPGLNVYTGTEAPLDFETTVKSSCASHPNFGCTYSQGAITSVDGEDGNTAMKFPKIADTFPHIALTPETAPVIEADRPVTLSFKYKSNGAYHFIAVRNVTNNTDPYIMDFTTENTNGAWTSYSAVFAGNAKDASGKSNHIHTDDTKDIKLLTYMVTRTPNASADAVLYVDDISLVPYYKLSYNANGGEGTLPDPLYFEGGEYTDIDKDVIPTRAGYIFKGWATTPDATEAVSSVTPTKGEDVVLYAVWEGIKPGVNIFTGTEKPLGFENASDLDNLTLSNSSYVFASTLASDDGENNTGMFITSQYHYFHLTEMPTIERKRPIKISFDYYYNGQARVTANVIPSVGVNKHDLVYLHGKPAGSWNHFEGVRQGDTLRTGDSGDYRFFFESVDISTLYFYAYSASSSTNKDKPLVYDNISVIPYYGVHYDPNGGEGTAESDYFESGTFTALDDGSGLSRDGFAFAGWSLTKNGDAVSSVTASGNSDITLYAVWERKLSLTPGLNILTGTSEPYDFEGNNSIVVFSGTPSETENAVVVKPTADNPNNKAAAISNGKKYLYFNNLPTIEKERPVDYSFDYVYGGQLRVTINGNKDGYQSLLLQYGGSNDKWATHKAEGRKSIDGLTNGGDLQYVGGEDIHQLYFMSYSYSATTSYFDNISMVPYYKINYDANGGSGTAQADYFKNGTYSDLDDGLSLSNPGYLFDGWSLTPDGETVDSVTAVPGKDITLYAQWKDGTVTVEFKGDIKEIASVTAAAGSEFELENYLDVTISEEAASKGLHFNGWSLTEDGKDFSTDKIFLKDLEGDAVITLYAVVNNDINLAVPRNRALFKGSDNSTLSQGEYGDTLKVNGTAAETQNAFNIPTDDYMGAVVYLANDFTVSGTASDINSLSALSPLGIKTADSYTFPAPEKLAGYGVDAASFNASLDTVTAPDGRIFKGVPVTLETALGMAGTWENVTGIALSLGMENAEFEVRYIRFVPYYDIDTKVTIPSPKAGETPVTEITGKGYTASITWSPSADKFDYGTVYTANVKINTEPCYKTVNVAENGYTVENAVVTNNAGSNSFKAVFGKTENIPVTVTLYKADGSVLNSYTTPAESKISLPGAPASVSGSWFKGWQNKEGTILAISSIWPSEDVNLYPVYEEYASSLPGINMIYNSDAQGTEFGFSPANGMIEIVKENGFELNSVYKYKRSSGYTSIQHPITWETGRKYLISYRVKTDFTTSPATNINIIHSSKNNVKAARYTNGANWVTHTYSFEFTDDYTVTSSDALSLYVNPNQDNAGGTVFYDDVVLTPYYKITYNLNDGSAGVNTSWWLPEKGEKLYTLDTEMLVRRGYIFKGWSVDGENVIKTYEFTAGKDMEFTAVWEEADETDLFSYSFASDVAGVADGTLLVVTDEDSPYTTAEVYMADDNGVLDEYTSFAVFEITDGIGKYVVSGRRAFANGATALVITLKGEGAEDLTINYTIPEEHRFVTDKKPNYSIFVLSDLHLGGKLDDIDYFYMGEEATQSKKDAMGDGVKPGDVFKKDENGETIADLVIINGDLVNYGHDDAYYWNILQRYADERLNIHGIPVFLTNGNHEYYSKDKDENGKDYFLADAMERVLGGQIDYIENTFSDTVKITRDETNPGSLYYAADVGQHKFIFMSIPEMSEDKKSASFAASPKQLAFIENQLYDGEQSNKTTFLVSHVGLSGYVAGSKDAISNADVVEEMLNRHPNTIVCSAHSHSNLGIDEHYTVVGDMKTKFTHTNDGSVAYLDKLPGADDRTKDYLAGQYVEIYDDKIIMSARKFDEVSQYFGHAVYMIDVPGGSKELPEISIGGAPYDGNTLTALVNGEIPSDDAGYTYEWFVGSNVIGTGKTLSFRLNEQYLGKYVRLRVTDAEGNFVSCNSEIVASELEKRPVTLDVASIKNTLPQGIRYACFVNSAVRESDTVEEYGFIVSVKHGLVSANPEDTAFDALKFNAQGEREGTLDGSTVPYVSAPAYVKDGSDFSEEYSFEEAKTIFPEYSLGEIDGDGYYYTIVLSNIAEKHYDKALVGKPYIKVNGVYYYGKPVVKSVYDVALQLKQKHEEEGTEVPQSVLDVIDAVENK